MKYSPSRFAATFALGAVAAAVFSAVPAQAAPGQPTVITPPAVKDGSNWSRAPFPAARQVDDVKGPDGQAIDAIGANSPNTKIDPPTPPARVAILQPAPAAAPAVAPGILGDPGLLPTGRVAVATSSLVNAHAFAPTVRGTPISSRDQVIADLEARLKTSENALAAFRNTAPQMSRDGRRVFKAADDEVKDKARDLKKSIRTARSASQSQWDNAREKLATDVEAYGAALVRVDAAVGVMPANP